MTPRLDYAPLYFIAICARTRVPERLAALSLFGDREESVYQHYNHEVRKNMSAGGRIAELEEEVRQLRAQAQPARTNPRPQSTTGAGGAASKPTNEYRSHYRSTTAR